MRFLMILTDVETTQLAPGDPGFAERMAQYVAFDELATGLGVLRASGKLRPAAEGRTIRVRDGKTIVSDGPFAETKEQVGGFYLLECDDMAQAVELAARIPTAQHGSVEVRALYW